MFSHSVHPFLDNTILPYIILKIYSRNLIYSILVVLPLILLNTSLFRLVNNSRINFCAFSSFVSFFVPAFPISRSSMDISYSPIHFKPSSPKENATGFSFLARESFLLIYHSDILFLLFFHLFHKQDASYCRCDINGSQGTVIALTSR